MDGCLIAGCADEPTMGTFCAEHVPRIVKESISWWADSTAEKGIVYFIREGDGGPMKVGFTAEDPERRLRELQTGNPRGLHLVAWIPASRDVERTLHDRLRGNRLMGEWFRCADALVAEIAAAGERSDEIAALGVRTLPITSYERIYGLAPAEGVAI